ncbi:MAG: reprolysin-like metallopeptidase [Roseibacillus sp.]
MISRRTSPLLASLSLLLIGCLLLLAPRTKEQAIKAQAPTSRNEAKSQQASTRGERPSVQPNLHQNSSPQETNAFAAKFSQLRRGSHQRLLVAEAVVSERKAEPDGISPEVLFSPTPQASSGPLTFNEHTLSAIETSFDADALASFLNSSDSMIRIPLSQDAEVLVTFDQVVTRGEHTTTLTGQVVNESYSDVLLVFHDGAVSGSIAFHDSNIHYEFGTAGNGQVAIRRLNPYSFEAGCAGCAPELLAANASAFESEAILNDEIQGELLAAPAGSNPFDLVVGYSAEARISEGGTAAMEAKIIASVDRLNLAMDNSEAGNYFCSLLAMLEEPDATFSDANYSDMQDMLIDLRQTTNGILDTMTDLQEELGADLATFISNGVISGTAGIAGRPGAYSIVSRTYMTSTRLTFAHELGHNMGLRHAWGDTPGGSSSNPKNVDNYGWRFRTSNGTKISTIMAYSSGWGGSRIPYFSNPSVSYNGALTGAVDGFDATDTSASPAYDQQLVTDGIIGELGSGFDGTNSQLGAQNAQYLSNNNQVLVNRKTRSPLAVLEPASGTELAPTNAITIFWHGGDHSDSVALELYQGGIFHSTIASGLSGEERWYDWTVPNVTGAADYTIRVTLNGSTSIDSGAFIIGTPIVSLPYAESFENGFGAWIQSQSDEMDWTRNSGGTTTEGTGPSAASEGNWYLYIEPHDSYNVHNKVAQIDAIFDLSRVSSAELSFEYHMFGVNIDYLAVDIYDGTTWTTNAWLRTNAQQVSSENPWLNAVVDLSAYVGNDEVTLRFRAKQKYWHVSDISIDNITVDGPLALPYTESFEDGIGGWVQSTNDDYDWTLNSGGTSTPLAGPNGASDGSYYLYAEGHDTTGSYQNSSVEARFDLSSASATELTFDYHMYGFYIDYLAVDINDGSGWVEDIWLKDGPQQSSSGEPWLKAVVDLTPYAGNSDVRLRFRTATLLWNAADPSIDNLKIISSNTTVNGVPFDWLASYGLEPSEAGAQGNADNDSQNNEAEWFFGTDPLVLDSPIKTLLSSATEMTLTYTRRKLDGVNVFAEWSPNLTETSWLTTNLTEVVSGDDGTIETVTVTAPMDEDRRFIRIRVDQ